MEKIITVKAPKALIKLLTSKDCRRGDKYKNSDLGISEGSRNSELASIAGFARRKGQGEADIVNILKGVKCNPPLEDSEIRNIARSVARYPVGNNDCPIVWIESWIIDKHLTLKLNSTMEIMGKSTTLDTVKDMIYLDAKRTNAKGITPTLISSYLNVWIEEQKEVAIKELNESISFTQDDKSIEDFIFGITGKKDIVDISIMYHWIANIKRKLKGYYVKDHIMPVIVGKTGSGKSVAIHKLIEPLIDITLESDLAMVNDSRNDFNYTNKAIIFFDELSRAKSTDVSALKQKITAPTIEYRKLGTNNNIQGRNVASFIGASNNELRDTIYDPTSSRRYYQINTLEKCDWPIINNINYLSLWRGVNEDQDIDYLKGHRENLKERQGLIKALDSVEEWFEEFDFMPKDHNSDYYPTERIYKAYIVWMDAQNRGKYIHTKAKFCRILKSLCGESKTISNQRHYNLSSAFNTEYLDINDKGLYRHKIFSIN